MFLACLGQSIAIFHIALYKPKVFSFFFFFFYKQKRYFVASARAYVRMKCISLVATAKAHTTPSFRGTHFLQYIDPSAHHSQEREKRERERERERAREREKGGK